MLRYSRKREAILNVMRQTKTHPSAEWVYEKLKPQFPDLSLGTVYRNISRFLETGEVTRVATVGGQERYDADTSSHAHYICSNCGDVIDIDMPIDTSLAQMAEFAIGGRVDEIRLIFEGVCKNCKCGEAAST